MTSFEGSLACCSLKPTCRSKSALRTDQIRSDRSSIPTVHDLDPSGHDLLLIARVAEWEPYTTCMTYEQMLPGLDLCYTGPATAIPSHSGGLDDLDDLDDLDEYTI